MPDPQPISVSDDTLRPRDKYGPAKALSMIAAATGLMLPPAMAARASGKPYIFPRYWHQLVLKAMGVKTRLLGKQTGRPVLYVANHLSWLDIPVLGSRLDASFVAKSEVAAMPGVGFLAGLQDTIFVAREDRRRSADQANEILNRLLSGGSVILFPEGTSADGVRVLPFKTTLFSVLDGAAAENIMVQPVSLAYTHLNAMPLTRQRLMDIVWIGDMDFAPHALDFMRIGSTSAAIALHEPVARADFKDRKALARHCHDVVSTGYQKLMRGEL